MKATPKDNIIHFPKKKYTSSYKKRNKVKPYIKTDDDWFEITRANDASKKLSEKAVKLCSKLEYELHKSKDRPVFLSPYWFEKITRNARHQNARLRCQISHIFNFTFHAKIVHEGVFYSNVYEVSHTLESNKILNLEDVIIEKIKPSKPQKPKLYSSSKNAPGVEHKSDTYIIENKEKEEEALAYSSSFSNNKKLKIKSFSEQLSQEENIEERTLAASPFEGLAKVQQKEEIRREASFSLGQSAAEEKERRQAANNRESSTEDLISLGSIPILAKFCNPYISKEKEETPPVIIEKIEENAELGYNSQEPDNPNQVCKMETDINSLIFKAFGRETGDQLIKNCTIDLIEPNKVGIKVGQGLTITNYEREQLRDCIHTAYGENVKIISLNKPEEKPRANKGTDFQPRVETPERSELWEIFKKTIKTYLEPQMFKNWFERLKHTQNLNENKLIFIGSDFMISYITNNFGRCIEATVVKNEINIEFHIEGRPSSEWKIYEVEQTKIRYEGKERYYEDFRRLVPKK